MTQLLSSLETEFCSPVPGVLSLTNSPASDKGLCTKESPVLTMVGSVIRHWCKILAERAWNEAEGMWSLCVREFSSVELDGPAKSVYSVL